ncbi:hypothetical protein HOF92_06545, partial [bacterium]|nr:hypothetical protein [bacterium]
FPGNQENVQVRLRSDDDAISDPSDAFSVIGTEISKPDVDSHLASATITYDLTGVQGVAHEIFLEYSTNFGFTWTPSTSISGDTTGVLPGEGHVIEWDTSNVFPGSVPFLQVRLKSDDNAISPPSDGFTHYHTQISKPIVNPVLHSAEITFDLSGVPGVERDITLIYSLDGGFTWNADGNISGDIENILPGTGYTLTWNTSAVFPGNQENVIVRLVSDDLAVSPSSDPFGAVGTQISKPLVDPQVHSASITYDLSGVTGITHTIALEYSLDGGLTWTADTNISGDIAGVLPGAGHTIVWDTSSVFPGNQDNVRVRLISDDLAISPDSDPFGAIGTVISKPIVDPVLHSVSITYDLTAVAGVAHDISLEYSLDGGTTWTADSNISGDITGILDGDGYTIVWDTSQVFPGNQDNVRVRLISDDNAISPESDPFGAIGTEISKPIADPILHSVEITYDLTGVPGVPHDIFLEYSLDGGTTWIASPEISGDTNGVLPGPGLTLTWDTSEVFPGNQDNVQVRLISDDQAVSEPSDPFDVIGTEISKPLVDPILGSILITYDLSGVAGVEHEIFLEYSLDNGATWTSDGNLNGNTTSVLPGEALTMEWDTSQVFGGNQPNLVIRLVSDDLAFSPPSDAFDVLHTEISKPDVNPVLHSATITYDLIAVPGVNRNIFLEYSLDGGTTWTPDNNVSGDILGVLPGTGLTIVWDTSAVFPGNVDNVLVRLFSDDLAFSPPSDPFSIIGTEISKPDVDPVLHSATITYDLTGVPGVAHEISLEYSLNGGVSWIADTNISGDTSGILPGESYSIVWDTDAVFPRNQFDVRVRLISDDLAISPSSDPFGVIGTTLSKPLVDPVLYSATITYDLSGVAGVDHDISLEYSTDGGTTWIPDTNISGDITGVLPGAGHEIVWDYSAIYTENVPDVIVRLITEDLAISPPSDPFDIINTEITKPLVDPQLFYVVINYDLLAAPGVPRDLFLEFSVDGGATWTQSTAISGDVSSVLPGTSLTMTWMTSQVFSGNEDMVYVRLYSDDGAISPISDPMDIINTRIGVPEAAAEYGLVTITYDLEGLAGALYDLALQYSTDGGL